MRRVESSGKLTTPHTMYCASNYNMMTRKQR